jgi:hypothetical protein
MKAPSCDEGLVERGELGGAELLGLRHEVLAQEVRVPGQRLGERRDDDAPGREIGGRGVPPGQPAVDEESDAAARWRGPAGACRRAGSGAGAKPPRVTPEMLLKRHASSVRPGRGKRGEPGVGRALALEPPGGGAA